MAAHPSITPEDVRKRAKWVYEYLSKLGDEGVAWVPFHPSNWHVADIPEPDKQYGWTSPITPHRGPHAGNVVVRFCPKIIAEATLTMPFQPDNRARFRRSETDQGDDRNDAEAERTAAISSLWFADNYVKAIGWILAEEIAIVRAGDGPPAAARAMAEDCLYDQIPAALALVSEVQLQAFGPPGR